MEPAIAQSIVSSLCTALRPTASRRPPFPDRHIVNHNIPRDVRTAAPLPARIRLGTSADLRHQPDSPPGINHSELGTTIIHLDLQPIILIHRPSPRTLGNQHLQDQTERSRTSVRHMHPNAANQHFTDNRQTRASGASQLTVAFIRTDRHAILRSRPNYGNFRRK